MWNKRTEPRSPRKGVLAPLFPVRTQPTVEDCLWIYGKYGLVFLCIVLLLLLSWRRPTLQSTNTHEAVMCIRKALWGRVLWPTVQWCIVNTRWPLWEIWSWFGTNRLFRNKTKWSRCEKHPQCNRCSVDSRHIKMRNIPHHNTTASKNQNLVNKFPKEIVFSPSIHQFFCHCLSCTRSHRGAGTYPSCLRAKVGDTLDKR